MRLVVMSFLVGCSYSPPPSAVVDSPPGDGAEADTLPVDAPEGSWLVGWSHRKSIDIDDGEVRGDLANFPVMINFLADEDIAGIALADGSDLAVRMGGLFSWRGVLDQIEIASEARSPAWIETAFRNQRTGSTFLTLGEQEPDPN